MRWLLILALACQLPAANRYWVGGGSSTNWDATGSTNWGTASGVRDNAGVPGSADDVFFDGAVNGDSNSTISASINIKSLDMTGWSAGTVRTLTHNTSVILTISGAGGIFKLASGMTYTLGAPSTSTITFTATSGTNQITTAGKATGSITFNGAGGTFQLQDSYSSSTAVWTLTAGTLDTNSQTVTIAAISTNNANTRTITMGSSSISLSNVGANGYNATTVTNLTITANTATITLGNSTNFTSGLKDYNGLTLVFNGSGAQNLNSAGSTFANVTRTGTAVKTDSFSPDAAVTITGTFTVNGNSSVNRVLVQSSVLGTSRTITAATVAITNADFRDITGAGAGSWNLSAISGGSGDCGGNTGSFTFTAGAQQFWVGGTGSWSTAAEWGTTSGGSGGRVPLPQDDVRFDANSFTAGSQTATLDMPRAGKNIDWTGVTNTPAWAKTTASSIFGSLTLVSGMTNTGTTALTFHGRGSHTITSAGQTVTNGLFTSTVGGTITLQDALTLSSSFDHTNGTFTANGFNVSTPLFNSDGSATRVLNLGSGSWTVTSASSGLWRVASAGATVNAGTSTIVLNNGTSSAKTFVGNGFTFNNLTIATDNATISGSNTFATLAVNNAGLTNGLKLTSGTTQTVTGFTTNGSAGNLAKLLSTTGASAATISKASGTVSVDYMSIQDSTATGGAAFYAGANSTNVSGNTGWTFTAPPGGTVSRRRRSPRPLAAQFHEGE